MLKRKRKFSHLNKNAKVFSPNKETIKLIAQSNSKIQSISLSQSRNQIFYNNNNYSKLLFTITPINHYYAYIRTFKDIPIKIYSTLIPLLKEIHIDSLVLLINFEEITISAIIKEGMSSFINFKFEIDKGKDKEFLFNRQETQDTSIINDEVTFEESYNYETNDLYENKCYICLDFISCGKEGILNECKHKFCYSCIYKWSKYSSECPICKNNFSEIQYHNINKEGKRMVKKIKKKKFRFYYDFEDQINDDIVDKACNYCMICGKGSNREVLLICDKCQFNVCHTYCDGINKIPNGLWFCEKCRGRKENNI